MQAHTYFNGIPSVYIVCAFWFKPSCWNQIFTCYYFVHEIYMSLWYVESSGTLQETTHMFKVTTKVVSFKTVPKLHSVRCRTPWWPSCIMEANSSSSQLRDQPGSEGRDGQWIPCCLGRLLTLVENWKRLRYPPVCGDGGGCSWKPLSISGKAEWRAWTPGEIHGTEAGR